MKNFKSVTVMLIISAVFLALTPALAAWLEVQRGYKAIGGEVFFPFLPLPGWALWRMFSDMTKEIKKTFESEVSKNDEV
jgi:hypothetical protein